MPRPLYALLVPLLLPVAGCVTNYTVPNIEVTRDTLGKLDEAAQGLGCKTTRYTIPGDGSSNPQHAWVHDEMGVSCDGTFVSFRQRLTTAYDLDTAIVYAYNCKAECVAKVNEIVARLEGEPPPVKTVEAPATTKPAPKPAPEPALEARPPQPPAPAPLEWSEAFFGDRRVGTMVTECTPRGEEVCNNGIDDNCDGFYDDADCGLEMGPLEFTLLWTSSADLDLTIIGPDGKSVSADHGGSNAIEWQRACGGKASGTCIEHAFVAGGKPPPSGTYRVKVVLKGLGEVDTTTPIECRLAGQIGPRSYFNDLSLAPNVGAAYSLAFAIGSDADRDGVIDEEDACPEAAGRWSDDTVARGCPDRDEDGVADRADACPDKSGLTQTDPQQNGCPLVFGDAWVTNSGVTITSRIEFATGKATLRTEGENTLRNVAKAIQARPGAVRKLAVQGHTDDVGDRKRNLDLSRRRAEAVVDFLATQGTPRAKLVAQGYADLRPVASNDDAEGRQKNRRVEFVVTDPTPRTLDNW